MKKEKKKKKSGTSSLFPPAAKGREKNCLTLAAYFLSLETPDLPACYLSQGKSEGGDKYFKISQFFWNTAGWSYIFFSFIFISWRLITLQYCSGFCHTLT